jgi:hypothetical protein
MDAHNFNKVTLLQHTSSYIFWSSIAPTSGSAQLYVTVLYRFLYVAELSKTPYYATTRRKPFATVLYNCAPQWWGNEAQNVRAGTL